jgi:DtxR family transcriptional regulator, Mn-dependent transcriptional regulator
MFLCQATRWLSRLLLAPSNHAILLSMARKRLTEPESSTEVWKQFGENLVTHSAAHHLLAIRDLTVSRGYARVTDVAKHLRITTGSASTNLKALKQKGLVTEDDNRFLALSEEGRRIADAILDHRRTVQDFFIEVLSISPQQAEIDACKIEHLLSQETSSKMAEYVVKTK